MEKWCDQILLDLAKIKEPLRTCYIGGGTPSALPCSLLEKILSALQPITSSIEEFTVEANLENLTKEKCQLLQQYGVNRISLGIQTLQDELLAVIERHHCKADVQKTLELIHGCGIHNISIDLIYGLPNQTLSMWQEDLQWAASNPLISHISIYSLTIEKNSKFGRNHVQPCDVDLEADMYECAVQYLTEKHFEHYEISNFAKPQKQSLHNLAYWHYHDFIGIGCGAYGLENHVYYHIPFRLDEYVKGTLKRHEEVRDKKESMFECVMMGLRIKAGINRVDFEKRFACKIEDVYQQAIGENIQKGYLVLDEQSLKCSEKGFELLHEVLLSFMDD